MGRVPRLRGGKDTWENMIWSSKDVNMRKADRLPQEASLRLLSVPRAPKELPPHPMEYHCAHCSVVYLGRGSVDGCCRCFWISNRTPSTAKLHF